MKQNYIKTSVLLPTELTSALDRIAQQSAIPRAALVRRAVQAFVDQDGSSINLHRIASATVFCELALDHIIGISAPDKREALSAAAKARMEEFHVAR